MPCGLGFPNGAEKEALLRSMPNAVQCGRCQYGPIDHAPWVQISINWCRAAPPRPPSSPSSSSSFWSSSSSSFGSSKQQSGSWEIEIDKQRKLLFCQLIMMSRSPPPALDAHQAGCDDLDAHHAEWRGNARIAHFGADHSSFFCGAHKCAFCQRTQTKRAFPLMRDEPYPVQPSESNMMLCFFQVHIADEWFQHL